MADAEDLKSSGAKAPCGFESRPRHHNKNQALIAICGSEAPANLLG